MADQLTSLMENLSIAESFEVPPNSKMFDNADETFQAVFKDVDFTKVERIKLSANSYATEPCKWIAENVLSKCTALKVADFSDMFTTRLKSDLPESLKYLIDAIADKAIVSLSLSHNAFGPAGVKSFEHFLSSCKSLKVLDVTNCGLGP
mmetsp:Transcript_31183/g.47741  ORF Transcript_31183/g.47741 Transcript_31183/m.47741 type:complete len:149 (+) Transcript_31183:48-494(+)